MAAKTTHRSWSWINRYSCECRDFIMKHRKEIIHVVVRHSCDSCNYNATELSNLKRHTESKHEGLYMTILHIQLFCVLQICPFDVSWCLHYLQWYFVDSSSVSCKISFWCCLLMTLPTRNIYSLMDSSSVLCKFSFSCYLLLTLLTKYTLFLQELFLRWSTLPSVVAWY